MRTVKAAHCDLFFFYRSLRCCGVSRRPGYSPSGGLLRWVTNIQDEWGHQGRWPSPCVAVPIWLSMGRLVWLEAPHRCRPSPSWTGARLVVSVHVLPWEALMGLREDGGAPALTVEGVLVEGLLWASPQ
jgi:hypothetical protein